MERDLFEQLVSEEFPKAIPERFQARIHNVAFLVEDEPSERVRAQEELAEGETLLGLYAGIPLSARGASYGVGEVFPDTITLYQKPIEALAGDSEESLRQVIRDTIWHEVAHYFGFDEQSVRHREDTGTNISK